MLSTVEGGRTSMAVLTWAGSGSSGGGDRTRNTQLQRLLFCRLNYPRWSFHGNARGCPFEHRLRGVPGWRGPAADTRVAGLMGSLIKKRRKRMRKKKHKKMLKRTRWQRRAAGK